MIRVVKMRVDSHTTVYGLDFIDCLVQLERVGVFPNDTLPHKCEFIALSVNTREYASLMRAANEESDAEG